MTWLEKPKKKKKIRLGLLHGSVYLELSSLQR